MINYEVSLSIQKEIFEEYYAWLVDHIEVILKIDGFQKVTLYRVQDVNDDDNEHIVASYLLTSREKFDHYLENYAKELRNDGVKRFGEKCVATRKILEIDKIFDKKISLDNVLNPTPGYFAL
ncbi:MAG: DUF4286 family protein [Legionellales bacterium]|nr:DUF4286 family protein [Legionellales bacterium]